MLQKTKQNYFWNISSLVKVPSCVLIRNKVWIGINLMNNKEDNQSLKIFTRLFRFGSLEGGSVQMIGSHPDNTMPSISICICAIIDSTDISLNFIKQNKSIALNNIQSPYNLNIILTCSDPLSTNILIFLVWCF